MPHAGFLIISGRILRDILIQNDSSQMNRSDLENNMAIYKDLIRNNAHLIIEFSQEGGILNAANS